jgi:uncharacterized membrane protein
MYSYFLQTFAYFTFLDLVAAILLALVWLLGGFWIDGGKSKKPSTSRLMANYRKLWMVQMIDREPRIFDATILGSLRQGTTFFASATMIAIGAGSALIGQTDRLQMVAEDLIADGQTPDVVWEIKILVLILLLANGFLKFVWAHRLFGYCAIVMASTPNDTTHDDTHVMAKRAAKLANFAARSFNRGLRSLYFALATLAWLLGPIAWIVAILATAIMMYRREFASHSRNAILGLDLDNPS